LDKSNYFYEYNLHRSQIQEALGDGYSVPGLILVKTRTDGQIVTLCTWPEHIASVFPKADYYVLGKNYKKLFRTIKENCVISAATFNSRFGALLDDYSFDGCRILHAHNENKVQKIFNSTTTELDPKASFGLMPLEQVVNVKPATVNA
jgi:hypothetical protein